MEESKGELSLDPVEDLTKAMDKWVRVNKYLVINSEIVGEVFRRVHDAHFIQWDGISLHLEINHEEYSIHAFFEQVFESVREREDAITGKVPVISDHLRGVAPSSGEGTVSTQVTYRLLKANAPNGLTAKQIAEKLGVLKGLNRKTHRALIHNRIRYVRIICRRLCNFHPDGFVIKGVRGNVIYGFKK